jgi:hypothetical protein
MLSVSEVEQSLASQESHQADLKVRPFFRGGRLMGRVS